MVIQTTKTIFTIFLRQFANNLGGGSDRLDLTDTLMTSGLSEKIRWTSTDPVKSPDKSILKYQHDNVFF